MPWNGSHGCSGTAIDSATIAASDATAPASAVNRRMRNGSNRQISQSNGIDSSAASANCQRKLGKTLFMNEKVAESMIRKSRNVRVSSRMRCLNCDSAISTANNASGNTAAIPGRPKIAMPIRTSRASVRNDSTIPNGPYSVRIRTAAAAA